MFCGFCGNDNEKQNEIVIRDPFSSDLGFKVNRQNANQMMSIMGEVVQYHVVKPSMYEQQLRKCRQKSIAFVDSEFPPNEKSLNYGVANRKIAWKRIRQIIPNAVMVDGRMDQTCVQQGNLGDCYFLACISSIAAVPERIQKIFCNQMQLKKEGIYRLQVACQGEYKQIIIDDFIPVFADTNRPVFSKPHDNQVWVMLIEKAWAKLSGSYGSIEAGYPHQVFQTFLVSPSYYYEIPNMMVKKPFQKLILWNNIKQASTHNRPMCAGSRQAYTCKGIKAAHTYSILGAYEVATNNNQSINLLKLRNPWGDVEYEGKYSEHDDGFWSTVNPMNKLAIFRKQNQEDGVFTMEFNQFIRNFQCLDISHECQDYSYNFQKVQAKSRQPIFFQLQIQRTQIQDFYLTMQKQFDRNSYIKHRQVQYGYSRLLIAKKNILQVEDKQIVSYQYTNSRLQTNFPDVTIRGSSLNPGKYIVMAETQFPNEKDGYLTISLYSKSIMNIRQIGYPDPLFLHKVFTNYAHQVAKPQNRVLLNNSGNDWTISQFIFGQGGFGYVCVYLGPASKQRVLITCNMKKIYESGFFLLQRKNVKEGILELVVNPNQQSLILFGVDFTKNLRQVTFPPKGIKISRII